MNPDQLGHHPHRVRRSGTGAFCVMESRKFLDFYDEYPCASPI
ncbi:MAG: hypothetical protein ACLU8D_02350 [Enterocloster sp.]